MAIASTTIPQDPVLGFIDDKEIKTAVFKHMRGMGNAFLIEADYHNLQNVNNALSVQPTNDLMRMVGGIVLTTLKEDQPAEIFAFRQSSGDEVSFLIQGNADEEKLTASLQRADERIRAFVEEAGLSTLRHHKYPNLAGAGIFTAFTAIDRTSNYETLSGGLHEEITVRKQEQEKPEAYTEARDYQTNGRQARFFEALNSEEWQQYQIDEIEFPDEVLRDFSRASDGVKATIKPRTARFGDLKNLSNEEGSHSLMRFDLYNLGGLNTHIGKIGADEVIRRVFKIVEEEVDNRFGETASLYRVSAGVVDAVVPEQNPIEIAALKEAISTRMHDEILSREVAGFDHDKEEITIAPNTLVGQIPYKSGDGVGVDVIMADTPIEPSEFPAALFERIDSMTEIQKIYGFSYIEEISEELLKGHGIASEETIDIDNQERDAENSFRYANSLKSIADPEVILAQHTKYVGQIAQQIFGLDITDTLQRHDIIRHLVAQGVDEAEILQNIESMAEFDAWLNERYPDHEGGTLTLLGRPNTHVSLDTRLMTLDLATHWGQMPEGLDKRILLGQLTQRTYVEVSRDGFSDTVEDSVNFLAGDIRLRFETEPDLHVRQVQFAHEATRMFSRLENVRAGQTIADSEVRGAVAEIVKTTAGELSSRIEEIGEPEIASTFQQVLRDPLLNSFEQCENPVVLLRKKIIEANSYITNHPTIEDEVKEKIVENFSALLKVADSFEGASPEPIHGISDRPPINLPV